MEFLLKPKGSTMGFAVEASRSGSRPRSGAPRSCLHSRGVNSNTSLAGCVETRSMMSRRSLPPLRVPRYFELSGPRPRAGAFLLLKRWVSLGRPRTAILEPLRLAASDVCHAVIATLTISLSTP